MALQRSGSASNASLLSRTRNLISNAARSASREVAGAARSAMEASFEAEVPTQHSGNIVGSSTQYQRIERLCRDVFRAVTLFYYTFQSMEEAGILHRNNDLHLFVLHLTFLPRINRAIESFNATAWNQHPIRTERNLTPMRIWSKR